MLDIRWIRENPDAAQQGLAAKGATLPLDELLDLDRRRRNLIQDVEQLKSQRNQANDEISRLKKKGESAETVISTIKTSSQQIKEIDTEVGDIEEKIATIMYTIPNLPDETVPVARGTTGNKVVRTWGEPRKHDFAAKDHLDLAKDLGWLSMERGSKITGSAFPVYQGFGAKLERTLINFMVDLHVSKHGYTEVWPPALVNRTSMTGTGQLPNLEEDMYALRDDDLFLVPTAEVPVTNLLRDETLDEKQLPVRYVAYSPCFRREAGSYGKDTRGLSRVHQFDKVEMVKFVKPESASEELETLVENAEAILQALELPYRVVLLGSGDMSFASSKCYDLEVWAPVSEKWYEISSCSMFGDFQARRINVRYRSSKTGKVEFVHTLNGSGVALARTVLCLLENFQTADGKVNFPEALAAYLS
ncbi:MAG: serine--tRNA ligase [Candidatus Omnitrophota bacterium]|nr:serine--tRNA ligase [Candidatus Omnitrophota bacterium]